MHYEEAKKNTVVRGIVMRNMLMVARNLLAELSCQQEPICYFADDSRREVYLMENLWQTPEKINDEDFEWLQGVIDDAIGQLAMIGEKELMQSQSDSVRSLALLAR